MSGLAQPWVAVSPAYPAMDPPSFTPSPAHMSGNTTTVDHGLRLC